MRLKKIHVEKYCNLNHFEVEFNDSNVLILVGSNGCGKSNLFEVISQIVTAVFLQTNTDFKFRLDYQLKDKFVPLLNYSGNIRTNMVVGEGTISKKIFPRILNEDLSPLLFDSLFIYYSGENKRIYNLFKEDLEEEYKKEINNEHLQNKKINFLSFRHYPIIILVLLLYNPKFLKKIKIKDFTNLRIKLKKPKYRKKEYPTWDYIEPHFWGLSGYKKQFLQELYYLANNEKDTTVLYKEGNLDIKLFKDDLLKLKNKYKSEDFFKHFNNLIILDMIKDIDFNLILEKDETISYKELSEGELQYIFILGFLSICENKDYLFLLDEPETHLNPHWKLNYINEIKEILKDKPNIQAIINTPNPFGVYSGDTTVLSLNTKTSLASKFPTKRGSCVFIIA